MRCAWRRRPWPRCRRWRSNSPRSCSTRPLRPGTTLVTHPWPTETPSLRPSHCLKVLTWTLVVSPGLSVASAKMQQQHQCRNYMAEVRPGETSKSAPVVQVADTGSRRCHLVSLWGGMRKGRKHCCPSDVHRHLSKLCPRSLFALSVQSMRPAMVVRCLTGVMCCKYDISIPEPYMCCKQGTPVGPSGAWTRRRSCRTGRSAPSACTLWRRCPLQHMPSAPTCSTSPSRRVRVASTPDCPVVLLSV